MKIAAARAIAELAHRPVPKTIAHAYGHEDLCFGKDYILPKPFDRRLLTTVAPAVILAAMESGVARKAITDMEYYKATLQTIACSNDALIAYLIKMQGQCMIGSHPRRQA